MESYWINVEMRLEISPICSYHLAEIAWMYYVSFSKLCGHTDTVFLMLCFLFYCEERFFAICFVKGTSAQPHGFQSKVCAKTDMDQCNWPTLGVADGQESLACCSPLGRKQSDTAELN